MPNELKLCPFCGRIPQLKIIPSDRRIEIKLECQCGIRKSEYLKAVPYAELTDITSSVDEVTKEWNRRADNV